MFSSKVIARGEKFAILEIERNGTSTLKKFFKSFSGEQQAGVTSAIKFIADKGPPNNESKFRHEGDGIYAIKDGQIRIYCFYDTDSQIVLTNGVIKKAKKADPNELKRAKKLRKAYLRSRA